MLPSMVMVSEFDLITRITELAHGDDPHTLVGVGDDAAVLLPQPGHELVVTMDTLNEGVHFFPGVAAEDLGHKSLAVNLSDLAAMGAEPKWALLSVSMPGGDANWLQNFMEGFLDLAREHGVRLVGGDTCSGPLSITVTAMGQVASGSRLLRSTARPGDLVVVSGALGDAGYALDRMKQGRSVPVSLRTALLRPIPRIGLGQRLVGKATACIDISDGLMADLAHIATASGCGAELEASALPMSPELASLDGDERWSLQLTAGDDYELCFTWPREAQDELEPLSDETGIALTVVGRMVRSPGIVCLLPDGDRFEPLVKGHEHFNE